MSRYTKLTPKQTELLVEISILQQAVFDWGEEPIDLEPSPAIRQLQIGLNKIRRLVTALEK